MTKQSDKESSQRPKVLAADMTAVFNFGDPNERYQKFLQRGRPALRRLFESTLLHDMIVIPTQDFMSATVLVGVLGERTVLELLERGGLRFLRVQGALAYVGNGGGIQSYEMTSAGGEQGAFCASAEAALAWALRGLTEQPSDAEGLKRRVLEASTEVKVASLVGDIRHETYMDVLNSPYLQELFALRSRNMERLVGIAPNQVRIYGGPDADWHGDEIDIVMSLAAANLELRLADAAGCADASTASPVGHLLKAKAERSLGGRDAAEAFAVLREVADVPDIGEGVLAKEVPIDQVLRLRTSRAGEQFREWFHRNARGDAVTVCREFAKLLGEVPAVQRLPARVLRFIVTTGLGAIPIVGPVVGAVAGAVDSFFLERWLKGGSPKFFIENLRQLHGKPNLR
jgi:hypothetical protein